MSRALHIQHTLRYWCPGCGECHFTPVDAAYYAAAGRVGPVWSWNGSVDLPTLGPSVKLSWGREEAHVCHYVVENGRIAYQLDSTHALAGKTLDLPELAALEPGSTLPEPAAP